MIRKCLTCKTEVNDFNDHVKDLWHTYNLRRETVGLHPVSQDAFRAKQAELVVAVEPRKNYRCCSKNYKCLKTYESHLKSKKHAERSIEAAEDAEVLEDDEELEEEGDLLETEEEEEDESTETPLTIVDCLFCNHASKDFQGNLSHMKKKHEFAFPYPEFLRDAEGLMNYLINLIDTYAVCLKCDKQFYDRLSVRNHMMDSNHYQINVHLENNAEVLSEFYNEIPETLSNLDSNLAQERLPNGKLIGNRQLIMYINQNLNGLHNTNNLAIRSGMDKANMSLLHVGRTLKLAKPGLLTHEEKKLKSKEARYRQYRASRFSNFQAHYRHQILM